MTKLPRHQSPKADTERPDRHTVLIGAQPKAGLKPREALKRWSNPGRIRRTHRALGTNEPPGLHDPDVTHEPTYKQKREALEAALIRKLIDREIYGSGIGPSGNREIIDPSLWECLTIYDDFDEAAGENWKYEKSSSSS